jgi:hypothetical protein
VASTPVRREQSRESSLGEAEPADRRQRHRVHEGQAAAEEQQYDGIQRDVEGAEGQPQRREAITQ